MILIEQQVTTTTRIKINPYLPINVDFKRGLVRDHLNMLLIISIINYLLHKH